MYSHKKPLKELNWKKIVMKTTLLWIHVIGIGCCFGSVILMYIASYNFIIYGGFIFYESNLFISTIEFISTNIGIGYCMYLLISVWRRIK
jgi:hypothetical protein